MAIRPPFPADDFFPREAVVSRLSRRMENFLTVLIQEFAEHSPGIRENGRCNIQVTFVYRVASDSVQICLYGGDGSHRTATIWSSEIDSNEDVFDYIRRRWRWGNVDYFRQEGEINYRDARQKRESGATRARQLLLDNLTPAQRKTYVASGIFDLVGSHTKRLYRIVNEPALNIYQFYRYRGKTRVIERLCFGPEGVNHLGDILLTQKIILENDEQQGLYWANRWKVDWPIEAIGGEDAMGPVTHQHESVGAPIEPERHQPRQSYILQTPLHDEPPGIIETIRRRFNW